MKFSIKYLWKYVKANLFTSLILIDTRSNLDPTFLDKVPISSCWFKSYYFCK